MTHMPLNQAMLTEQRKQLKMYQQFLPSLDLKRKQLLAERVKSTQRLRGLQEQSDALTRHVGQSIPMLANEGTRLDALVRIKHIEQGEENIVGVIVPLLHEVEITVKEYSFFALPHWVDAVVQAMVESLRLRVAMQVEQQRLTALEAAAHVMTQRVNLFEKVLMPHSRNAIRAIGIYLSDAERAAVVRAKAAKRKRGTNVI